MVPATTILTRSDMRAALEHVEAAIVQLGEAFHRLSTVHATDEDGADRLALLHSLDHLEGELLRWCDAAIRLRQRLPRAYV